MAGETQRAPLWTVIGLHDDGQRAAYVVQSPNAARAEERAEGQADVGFEVAGVVRGAVEIYDAESDAVARRMGVKPKMHSWTVVGLYDDGQRAAFVVRSPNAAFAEQLASSMADAGFEIAGVLKGSVRLVG